MKQHQLSHHTEYNRYPNIFEVCSNHYKNKAVRILSFGCSNGTEVFTLRDLYFPDAEIHGVDINPTIIEGCNSKNADPKIRFTLTRDLLKSSDRYDIIFCMSVFCRWTQTENMLDCSEEYTFNEFEVQVKELFDHLHSGGALVIYNANFCFCETEIYSDFTPLTDKKIHESGFVHKFNSKNKKIDINYKDCIFIKK